IIEHWAKDGEKDTSKNSRTLPDFEEYAEYSEEEVAETMAKTMEQYMSNTQANYGSGVARPKIEDRDNFELKGQFLKELRIPTRQILDSRGAIPSKTNADAKPERLAQKGSYEPQFSEAYSKASHINNSIPLKEKDTGSELAHTKLTVELADMTVKYPKGIAENVLVGIGKFVFPVDFIILYMPEDIKVPLILERPFLSTARAKIDVYKEHITLRTGEERSIFKSVKPASSLIKRVDMLSLKERMDLDLEARLLRDLFVINRSL
ncbi:gag-pol polyprotein, partial [Tanacetum coccineum]